MSVINDARVHRVYFYSVDDYGLNRTTTLIHISTSRFNYILYTLTSSNSYVICRRDGCDDVLRAVVGFVDIPTAVRG